MIEFLHQNPNLVHVIRDGAEIGWLNRTKNQNNSSRTIWSGIVDNRTFRADTLCGVKKNIRDCIDDKVTIDLTEAGRKALAEHGSLRKQKVQVAAARGVSALDGIAVHFKIARTLADEGQTEKAVEQLAPLKDSLLSVLDALNFAGISGQTERN